MMSITLNIIIEELENAELSVPADHNCDESWDSALYLMRVTSELSLNHSEVDSVCSSTQWIVDVVSDRIAKKVKGCLTEAGISNPDLCKNIEEACTPDDIFSTLDSRYNRENYYQKYFNYVVRYNYYVNHIFTVYM